MILANFHANEDGNNKGAEMKKEKTNILLNKILRPKPLKKPPYKCPNTHDRRVGNGCSYPNCGCEWQC